MTKLSAEQIASGWLPHDGGPCPVPLDSKPGVVCLTGFVEMPGEGSADYWHWPIVIGYLPDPNYATETTTSDLLSAPLAPDEAVTQADRDAWEKYGPAIFYDEMTGPECLASYRVKCLIAAGTELAKRRENE